MVAQGDGNSALQRLTLESLQNKKKIGYNLHPVFILGHVSSFQAVQGNKELL